MRTFSKVCEPHNRPLSRTATPVRRRVGLFGPRDPDLADAARRWWKIDRRKCHDLEFIVARQHWEDEPLAVFRITDSMVVESGRVEFTVAAACVDEERDVLRAVAGRGVRYGAFRYDRT